MTEDSGTEGQVGRSGDIAVVNGPEDDVFDWPSIDWPTVEDDVRRLRQRIFTASQAGDLRKVRSLQKLMLRSRANALSSVRRVTEVNAGRQTAGVDKVVVVTAPGKACWLTVCANPHPPHRPDPSGGCTYRRRTGSSARSASLSSSTVRNRRW